MHLSQLGCWHDRQAAPFQDGDLSWNDLRLVPGFLRQPAGMFAEQFRRSSYSWVQGNLVQFGQKTQDARLCLAEISGQFFSQSTLNRFKNLLYMLFSDYRSRCVLRLAVPRILLCFLPDSCQISPISQFYHLQEKCSKVVKTEVFVSLTKFSCTTKT